MRLRIASAVATPVMRRSQRPHPRLPPVAAAQKRRWAAFELAGQLLTVQTRMRKRVWQAANAQLIEATLDTDTTVHTVYGRQMGRHKGYNPKNKGKYSYQPILTFLAETKNTWPENCTMETAPAEPR
jgi:hypothetical protein